MKLKDFNFNSLKCGRPIGLSIRLNHGKWYSGFVGEILSKIPSEFANKNIKETRWFFDEFVIELEDKEVSGNAMEREGNMDKLFYIIEQDGDKKSMHILAEIFYNGSDNEYSGKDYRVMEFTWQFFTSEHIKELGTGLLDNLYNNGGQCYEGDLTKQEAESDCNHYFGGESGTELDIFSVTEYTECGYYWCNI